MLNERTLDCLKQVLKIYGIVAFRIRSRKSQKGALTDAH